MSSSSASIENQAQDQENQDQEHVDETNHTGVVDNSYDRF